VHFRGQKAFAGLEYQEGKIFSAAGKLHSGCVKTKFVYFPTRLLAQCGSKTGGRKNWLIWGSDTYPLSEHCPLPLKNGGYSAFTQKTKKKTEVISQHQL
jgi:hypothetical protein